MLTEPRILIPKPDVSVHHVVTLAEQILHKVGCVWLNREEIHEAIDNAFYLADRYALLAEEYIRGNYKPEDRIAEREANQKVQVPIEEAISVPTTGSDVQV